MKLPEKKYDYSGFVSVVGELIEEAQKTIEQVIQFDSKYFRADPNLFKYDVNLFSKNQHDFVMKRLYLIIKNPKCSYEKRFKEYLNIYKSNGFDVKIILLCEIETKINIELNDLILIDNFKCITAKTNNEQKDSSSHNDITTYYLCDMNDNRRKIKKTRALLKQLRCEFFRQRNTLRIFEPLTESADINFYTANKFCKNGIMSTGNCQWYHAIWQYLRIIDKVSSPEWHSNFYQKCFNDVFKYKKNPKVLISGTADYSLLAYVYNSSKETNNEAEIFVLDTCQTPLKMCQWFSEKMGFDIKILNMSIFDLEQLYQTFDLICSDAFLTRFDIEDAKRVISCWKEALCEGGAVVTTVRIREDKGQEKNGLKETYIRDCVDRFKKWEGYFDITMSKFTSMVNEYAQKMTSHDLGDQKSVYNMFKSQGFQVIVDMSNINCTPGEFKETEYYEIYCRKETK